MSPWTHVQEIVKAAYDSVILCTELTHEQPIMLIFRLRQRMLFAGFLSFFFSFFPCTSYFPAQSLDEMKSLLEREKFSGPEEAERHCDLCSFLDFTEHDVRLCVFRHVSPSVTPTLPLPPLSPQP